MRPPSAIVAAATTAVAVALVTAIPGVATAQDADPCAGAEVRVVASGLGVLENLEPDGEGGMLVSSSDRNAIERVLPDGSVTTAVADVDRPGGLRLRDDGLWFNTGDGAVSGVLGVEDGTLQRVDLATGEREVVTAGLVMPNGLVFDDAGNAYVSRDLGLDASVTKIPVDDRADPEPGWADLADSNGLAIDPTGTFLYASSTFNLPASLFRVPLDAPEDAEEIAQFVDRGGPIVTKGLDDITIDAQGVLYLTANGSGELFRYDPATDESCVLTDALMNPSAVKFGAGPGWSTDALYVTGFDGRLVEVALPVPPATPAPTPTTVPSTPGPAPTMTATPSETVTTDPEAATPRPAMPVTGGGAISLAFAVLVVATRRRRRD